MKVKLSVFGVHRVRVMALSRPPHVKTVQDFAMIYENFDDVFIICYIKFIDWPETKMTDVDPSIVVKRLALVLEQISIW